MSVPALYRSSRNNVIAGVMGGIAERYGWNVTILRILFVILSTASAAFPGIIVYLVLWMVMPKASPQQNAPQSNSRW